MRRVLHVSAPGALLRQDGGRLIVELHGERLAAQPLEQLDGVYVYGRGVTVTTAVIALLVEAGIPLAWFTRTGRLRARCVPPTGKDVFRRLAQFERCRDPEACLRWAKSLCHRKLASQARFLLRRWRHQRRPTRAIAASLRRLHADIEQAPGLAVLRALEGRVSRLYFRAMARTLPDGLEFRARRRPADGVVNAGLNLLYTILTVRLDALAQAAGFDPGLAPFHRPAWGRPTLACDLVEPLRAPLVDAFWFPALGLRRFTADDITPDGQYGCRFTQVAFAKLLGAWEEFLVERHAQSLCDAEVAGFRRWCEAGVVTPEAVTADGDEDRDGSPAQPDESSPGDSPI